jgi:hypothetical protein
MEWDYGAFEGQTTADLAHRRGSFSIWTTQVPKGESLSDVAARAKRVLNRNATDTESSAPVRRRPLGHLSQILQPQPTCKRVFDLLGI